MDGEQRKLSAKLDMIIQELGDWQLDEQKLKWLRELKSYLESQTQTGVESGGRVKT